ncbi:MAG: fructose bisphosphate aldolase [Deltaproteobacteria bacterium]|nr:fructose bisphosphate aldolase [Deltaproteobacteria bacterium]
MHTSGDDHKREPASSGRQPESSQDQNTVDDAGATLSQNAALQFEKWFRRIKSDPGFIAALDQSGGSTPKALAAYGIPESSYSTPEEMFAIVHAMRARIITSPAFNGERILGAILFEDTLDRTIEGLPTARYLWEVKGVVPFLKIDKGLEQEQDGVQLMKPISNLDELLSKSQSVFGTKMRSVIKLASREGIAAVVDQQFEIAGKILAAGRVPIIEPEVDIKSPEKGAAEELLLKELIAHLDRLSDHQSVMLKLTIPDNPDHYADCIKHPRCLRVVALSGGYSREEACSRLAENKGMIASFSRALSEELTAQMSDEEFASALDRSIQEIYDASSRKNNN